ncbi:MAG: nucleotidyltransferase domain-containing protein [Candidatus Roizmanbacteria bacterium]|nr:nucleotidyltransferase domain-containing protein [Candidatus Roizmanbacteria bacterium]
MDKTTITKELNTFISRAKAQLPVKRIILYGSFAKNSGRDDSDIDLLVLGDFKKNQINDPTLALYETYCDLNSKHQLHVIGLNVDDYENKKDSITLASIRNTGKTIFLAQNRI